MLLLRFACSETLFWSSSVPCQTKHIEMDIHFVREKVAIGHVKNMVGNGASGDVIRSRQLTSQVSRHWRDVFWMGVFMLHLVLVGVALADRLKIDRFTNMFLENQPGLTEDFWLLYAVAGAVGTFSVHILTTYRVVISVLCFWQKQFFWGVAFAVGAALQFLYVVSLWESHAFMLVMLSWLVVWSFGVAGVVTLSIGDGGRWWLLVVFCVNLFWTGAVLCNIIHVIVMGMVFLVLIHGGRQANSMPPKPLKGSLRYAVTTSFGSICSGSLITAAIWTLRWKWFHVMHIRGVRSKIGKNECLLCCIDFLFHLVETLVRCVDFLFHLVETLVRFFNKYAYVQVVLEFDVIFQTYSLLIAVYGKNFNRSARDAWELFQSTGVEALIAYDCSGAVILMGTLVGGLVGGTCAGVWTRIKHPDRVMMVGSTSMLMGMILVGLATVVESAVTSIYICYAEDPVLIQRWDAEFFNKMSEMLHQQLQHRSSQATQVLTSRFDSQTQETAAV
ncbi:hypothetical protein K7X08_006701 [Anisodus acutangulus]|uniref:Choline transporter-like protein n=1 Tax=Anisodus acutangulus TaxID=402998 RepID=A0A9Q1MVT5_9SOLA|nr:hypothetical protein K7X08_006701 [Anisodus acutangulus]